MKKMITLAAALLIGTAAIAQNAGTLWLGGGVGYHTNKTKNADKDVTYKTTDFSIIPQVQYFLSDDLSIGVGLDYNSLKRKDFFNSDMGNLAEMTDKRSSFGFMLGAYKYFSLSDKCSLYAGVTFTMDFGKTKIKYEFDDSSIESMTIEGGKVTDFNINLNAGINYAVTDNLCAFFQVGVLGYHNSKVKNGGSNGGIDFGVNGNGLTFGVMYKLF